jgi:hypothetical protein
VMFMPVQPISQFSPNAAAANDNDVHRVPLTIEPGTARR